jgi:hypothetical protein
MRPTKNCISDVCGTNFSKDVAVPYRLAFDNKDEVWNRVHLIATDKRCEIDSLVVYISDTSLSLKMVDFNDIENNGCNMARRANNMLKNESKDISQYVWCNGDVPTAREASRLSETHDVAWSMCWNGMNYLRAVLGWRIHGLMTISQAELETYKVYRSYDDLHFTEFLLGVVHEIYRFPEKVKEAIESGYYQRTCATVVRGY